MPHASETPPSRTRPLLLLTAALALTTASRAQSPTRPPEPTGSVTGHVFCSDTNQPARFAHVSLEAVPTASTTPTSSNPSSKPSSDPVSGNSVETTLDGSFTLTKVKPGTYYVVVEKEGYVKPRDIFTKKQIEDPSPDMRALIASALPRVTVESGHTDQAEVRLERGAAISGTILYDDGSPASELNIQLLHKDASGKWAPIQNSTHFNLRTQTDDRGIFRLASLLGDEYKVEADLTLSQSKTVTNTGADGQVMQFVMQSDFFTLHFYGAGTPRIDEAKPIKLLAGQELTGQDMMLPISKLHKLTGRVVAGADAHLVNAADVALITRDDNKQLATSEISRDDGLFHFEFVPDGDYILRVTNARDVVWEAPPPSSTPMAMPFPPQDKQRVLASYGGVDQPLILSGEMLGVIATVPPDAKPSPTSSTPTQN